MQAPINHTELDTLIKELRLGGQDTQQVEVKEAAGGLPKSILETLSAFSNGAGGDYYSGITRTEQLRLQPAVQSESNL